MMNCSFDVVAEDEYGALARIVGVFASLGLNIERLTAFPSERAGYTDVRVGLKADEDMLRTLSRKLRRIVNVVEVQGRLKPLEEIHGNPISPLSEFIEESAASY